ncbi:MAG: transposase, partial [Conexivisphaerales archaeon]
LARLHLHVNRQREDFQNKLINKIFKENDALILERLNTSAMMHNHSLAKSISDASWGKFARKAIFKAESLGKQVIFVDPWGTTQFCHRCLHWVPKDLSEREHVCSNCSEQLARDMNSALLLKRLGIQSSLAQDGGSSPAERGPLQIDEVDNQIRDDDAANEVQQKVGKSCKSEEVERDHTHADICCESSWMGLMGKPLL